MHFWTVLVAATLAAGCHAPISHTAEQTQHSSKVSSEPWLDFAGHPEAYIEQLKILVRAHAQLVYGHECSTVTIANDAFFPVEITGGGSPELAVSLGRAGCGPGPKSMWRGSGGEIVQFWRAEDGHPTLLLEQQLNEFAPAGDRLITLQHGGFCQAPGTSACRVTYRWDSLGGRLETAERKLSADMPHGLAIYDDNCLLGSGPCPVDSAAGK